MYFFSMVERTSLISGILSVMAVLPLAYWSQFEIQALNTNNVTDFFLERKFKTEVDRVLHCQAVGALLGAWLGALPIPLDWDRPWQTWPVTLVYGSTIMYVLGTFCGLVLALLSPLEHELKRE